MKNILLLIFGLTLLAILTTSSKIEKEFLPPGTLKMGNNVFVDKREVCNIDWLEYLIWTKQYYGVNSKEYLSILPDTTIWDKEKVTEVQRNYLWHPDFRFYPVVGITLEQAEAYCKWRTVRVNEFFWMKSENKTYEDIEKLKEGNESIPQRVVYRIPTKLEWEAISNNSNIKQTKQKKETRHLTYPTETKKNIRISGLSGNVSELTNESGIAMGGNWKIGQSYGEVKYDLPSNVIGFRCICQYNKK